MACASPLDLKIKGALIKDVFNLVGFVAHESREIVSKQDKNTLRTHNFSNILNSSNRRSEQVLKSQPTHIKKNSEKVNSKLFHQILKEEFNLEADLLSHEERYILREFQEEMKRATNMKMIFPNALYWEYKQFFDEERKMNELASC